MGGWVEKCTLDDGWQKKKSNEPGENIVLHVACGYKVLCHNFNLTPKLNGTRSKSTRKNRNIIIIEYAGPPKRCAPTQNIL